MDPFAFLESVIVRDVGRGSEHLAESVSGDLKAAAVHLANSADPVTIVTGFPVRTASGVHPETDGPIGAVALAQFLLASRAVTLLTDPFVSPLMHALRDHLSLDCQIIEHRSAEDVSEATLALAGDLIFVERPGPSASGLHMNMRGQSISEHIVPLEKARALSAYTWSLGIGDGGNEVGMGRVPRDVLVANVPLGETIGSTSDTDRLIVAAVSNWGAWALISGIATIRPELAFAARVALDPSLATDILRAASVAGAVDGVTGLVGESVDGIAWSTHLQVLAAIETALMFS